MLTVSLHHVRFQAFHGMYEEELLTGNEFEVSLQVSFVPGEKISNIHQTVNYVALHEILSARMKQPTALLETLAMDIAALVKERFPQVKEINITINKLSLPLVNFQGNASVCYCRKYDP